MTWRGVKAVLYRVVPFLAFWYFNKQGTDIDHAESLRDMVFGVIFWSIGPYVQAGIEDQ